MNFLKIDFSDKKRIKQFIELPFKLYASTPQWVPPLLNDTRKMLDPNRHPFYQNGAAALFLVFNDGGEPAGRIAALDNHKYNQYNQENSAFFYLFECENDDKLSGALFQAAFDWASSRGLTEMIGPKGFTVFDGLGLLVRGFEHRPAFGLPYNLPYYPDILKKAGFEVETELVSGYLDANMKFPNHIHELANRLKQRRGLYIARYRTRRDLEALIPKLKDLYNDTLAGTSGNAPLSDEEVESLADQLLWFADPRLIKIVMKENQPVGFMLAYPDISAALQRTRGRIFPFGWIHMLRELRRTKWININGAGMIAGYRGLGGTALLFSEMYKSVQESRYRYADIVQIGLENDRMQREMKNIGIDFYKQHAVYKRML